MKKWKKNTMKMAIIFFACVICTSSLLASYNVGDVVSNFSWTDNTSMTHSIYELIDAGKVVVFFWGGLGCGGCIMAAPVFQTLWETYSPGGHVYFLSESDWTYLGATYYNSYDIDPLYWDYGNGYVPFFAIIGDEYRLYYGDNSVYFSSYLEDAIASLGLYAGIDANILYGPASLGVQFYSNSIGSPDAWAWDLDGDGVIDSYEENPYLLYTDVGIYDVSLTVWSGADSASITIEDFITVTDGSNISGTVSGVWNTNYSPYQITDDISIPSGAELIIEPDVEIIANNNSQITVDGRLEADGSDRGPIIFTSDNQWKGIKFLNTQEDNLIQNCEITNATYCAVDIENSKVDIIENTIYENSTATQKGAAINIIGSDSVYIYKNLITNNTNSLLCSGIGCDNANPLISHNIIVNNTAGFAGAISLKSASEPTMINNTISNNESAYGFAAMWIEASSATIVNSILIDSVDVFNLSGSTVNVTYTCISGGYSGTGNINEDPMFENPTAGSGTSYNGLEADWGLLLDSPCIDTGDPNSPPDPDGTRADMGALYFHNIAVDPQFPNIGISLKNYPNPFNSETNISYNIKPNRNSKIIIYNIKGDIVKEFNNLPFEGNYGEIVWDGTDKNGNTVSNGVYFYKISNSEKSQVRKMVIMR